MPKERGKGIDRKPGVAGIERKHYFVDEAGDPTLFGARGKVLVRSEGCSRYFILGLADVKDPPTLATDLAALRARLLADPYFKDVPSMQLEQRKTAQLFHAKDDLPEVRREVFALIQRHTIRFYTGGGLLSLGAAADLRDARRPLSPAAVATVQSGD